MKNTFTALVVTALISYSGVSHSLDLDLEKKYTDYARHLCSSELLKGKDYETTVRSNGDVEFKILGSKGGGLHGTFIYSKKDWGQQQKVLAEKQPEQNQRYQDCVLTQVNYYRNAAKKK